MPRARCGMRLWASLALVPVFLGLAFAGPSLLHPFGLDPHVEALALEYWRPRMGGAFIGSMAWAAMGFFNGISAVRFTMAVVVVTTVSNAILNQLFIFELGMGMKGSAWGTNVAQLIGVVLAMVLFLRGEIGRGVSLEADVASALVGDPRAARGRPAHRRDVRRRRARARAVADDDRADRRDGRRRHADRHGADLDGLHADHRHRARGHDAGRPIHRRGQPRLGESPGQRRHRAVRGADGLVAVLLLVVGPWVLPLFVSSGGANAADVVALGLVLLWPAAAYQIFDGLYCGSSFCLRGAGDTRVPGRHRAGAVVVPVRAAGAHVDLRAGAGLDRRPATIRTRCQGRLARPDDLLHVVRLQHVLALAARRLAPRQTVDGALRRCLIDARSPPCL